MTTETDELQARIDALKQSQDEEHRAKKRDYARVYRARLREEREQRGDTIKRGRPRGQGGGNGQSRRTQQGSAVVSRDRRNTGNAAERYQREYPGDVGNTEYTEPTSFGFTANPDDTERASREDDREIAVRNIGTGENHARTSGVATRLRNTVKQRAEEWLDSGVEKLANLGKDEPKASKNGRRRKDAPDAYMEQEQPEKHHWYEFGPATQAADFIRDIGEEYARPFSDEEATSKEHDVADKLQYWADQADEFLTISNAQEAVSTVWRLDDEEAGILARVWLKRAKKDKRAAALLRATLEGSDYIAAAMILGSRGWNTTFWYPSHGGFNLREWRSRQESEQPQPRPLRAEVGPS